MSNKISRKKSANVSVHKESVSFCKQAPRNPENVFESILQKVGFVLGKENEPNELCVDQAIFLRDLNKLLCEKNKDKFISEFEAHLEDELRLKWSLLPTVTSVSCETARNVSQDSLVHLLLDIEIIQERISIFMLEKLVEFSYSENSALYDRAEGKSVACLIISQFRWLNKLVNGEILSDKLIELIEATPTEIQRDIIQLLPDVISEFDHPKVAKHLGEILLGNQELNVTILDTLTNLNIETTLLSDIRKKVLKIISSADLQDLPVIVKFILQDLDSSEAKETIRKLQRNLDFNSTFNPIISSTPINNKAQVSSKDIGICVLNIIKQSLKFQKSLCDEWIKHLDAIKGPQNHKSLDILIIIVLLSLEGYEKKAEIVLKNKIKIGDINEDLLHVTFRCHHDILQEYASILLKTAETFLRVTEPSVSAFGCSLYIKCFVWFDTFYKQEVIGNLITHIGNKSENEINTALNTMLSLVRCHTQKIAPFSLFVRNLLDHFDDLTLNQIRKIHEMLSILAYQGGREGSILLDDMLIVMRKQLTNKNLRYRKMGVIGALMAAKIAAEKENEKLTSEVSFSSDAFDVETCFQHSIKLLELVVQSTSETSEAFALFCDELSHVMIGKKLGDAILDWIGQNILADFEEMYIIDVTQEDCKKTGIGPKFGLDEVDEPVALDLYNIVLKHSQNFKFKAACNANISLSKCKKITKDADQSKILQTLLKISSEESTSGERISLASPIRIAPMFRLLQIFRLAQDGNLESIDALLGCSIVLPNFQSLKFATLSAVEKPIVVNTLFYCINWIRENLNAFATTTDQDIKCNVVSRLKLLIELESLVCEYLKGINDYVPPIANFDCEDLQNNFKLPSKKPVKRSAKSKKGKSKKVKTDTIVEQTEDNSQMTLLNSESCEEDYEPKGLTDNVLILKKLQPFFRELDIDVFNLFNFGITFQARSDHLSSKKLTSVELHPTELIFLLEDMSMKLQHSFNNIICHLKTAQKKTGFSNLDVHTTEKIASFSVSLLPSLCSLAEKCSKFFKTAFEDSDGVEDSLFMFSNDAQCIMKCLNLIFKVMRQIISWKNLKLTENVPLLKKAVLSFTSGSKIKESEDFEKLFCAAIDYLSSFSNAVPSLVCAANLIQLLSAFLEYVQDVEAKKNVSEIALKFLKKNWLDLNCKTVKNAEINGHIKIVLEAYLKNSESMLTSLNHLSEEAISQFANAEEENCLFNTLSKSSLTCYYKIMFNSLALYIKEYFSNKENNNSELLSHWAISFQIFHALTNLIKIFGSRYYVGICLKYSRDFLNTFLKHGMPLMDKLFASHKEDVINLMKSLQISTRYLQHVCSHSKVLKDVSLIKHVPFLKKSLEVFVFRVKMMLAVNKCEEAFWLGNLKHRNLKGVEILSQIPQSPDDDGISENEGSRESDKEDVEQNKSGSDISGIESDSD